MTLAYTPVTHFGIRLNRVIQTWTWSCFCPTKKTSSGYSLLLEKTKILVSTHKAMLLYLSTFLLFTGFLAHPSSVISLLYPSSFLTLGLRTSCSLAGNALTLPLWLANSYLFFDPQLIYYFTKIIFPCSSDSDRLPLCFIILTKDEKFN